MSRMRELTDNQKTALAHMGDAPVPVADIVNPLGWKASSNAAIRFVASLVARGAVKPAGYAPMPGYTSNSIKRRALYQKVAQ